MSLVLNRNMKILVVLTVWVLICSVNCKPSFKTKQIDEGLYGPLVDEDLQNDADQSPSDYEYLDKPIDNVNDNNDDEKLSVIDVKIESPPQIFEVNLNSSIRLPCKIVSNDSIVPIWKRLRYSSNSNLNVSSEILFQSSIPMAAPHRFHHFNDSLLIDNVEESDHGEYQCTAMVSQAVQPSITHVLRVKAPPKVLQITAKNNITTLKVGEDLTLVCKVSGYPAPNISWHKGGERFHMLGNTLTISNIKHRDAGTYQCLADNKIGQPAYSIINITVEHKPSVDVEKIVVTSDHNYNAELKCIVHAEPKANVIWQKDGHNIINSAHIQLKNEGHNHLLLIKGLQTSDFGDYTCLAINSIGEAKKHIKISKTPSVLAFIKPQKNIKDVILSWKVESKSPISLHELQYRKKGGEWETVNPEVTTEEDGVYMVRYPLKGLEAGVYETRIRSQNTHGWSDYSEIMPFEGVYAKNGHNKQHKKSRKDMKDKYNAHDTKDMLSENEIPPAEQHEKDSNDSVIEASLNSSSALGIVSSSLWCIALLLIFLNRQ